MAASALVVVSALFRCGPLEFLTTTKRKVGHRPGKETMALSKRHPCVIPERRGECGGSMTTQGAIPTRGAVSTAPQEAKVCGEDHRGQTVQEVQSLQPIRRQEVGMRGNRKMGGRRRLRMTPGDGITPPSGSWPPCPRQTDWGSDEGKAQQSVRASGGRVLGQQREHDHGVEKE